MDRSEFKNVLDTTARGSAYLSNLCGLFGHGTLRELTISAAGLTLVLHDDESVFSWDAADPRTAVASLVVSGQYEPIETAVLQTLAKRSALVLDIGANVGYYAVRLGKVIPSNGRIFCFEPLPECFRQLTANIELNKLGHSVKALQFAISDCDGTAELHVPQVSGTSASSMRVLHPDETNQAIQIETRRLDGVLRDLDLRDVDLIKIDVEGAEWLALSGGWACIERDQPMIFAELLRKWSAGFGYHPDIVVRKLRDLGYQCFAVSNRLSLITEINDATAETNFLFLAKKPAHDVCLEDLERLGLIA
jgi:FkbM family methyltransferase